MYVQYGCGYSAPENWRNFDASPTLRFERIPLIGKLYTKNESRFPDNVKFGDIVKGLPVDSEAVRGVYCSHILEHLSLEDFRTALKNTHNILENDGYFRLVIPDLEFIVKKYIDNPSESASVLFMREASLGKESRDKGFVGFIKDWIGNSQHLWMWDYKSVKQELENSGFINVRRAKYGDATDSMFNDVENEERWENCLGVECTKG